MVNLILISKIAVVDGGGSVGGAAALVKWAFVYAREMELKYSWFSTI